MTLTLKSLGMMSHPLPPPVLDMLKPLARELDEGLQAESHHVGTAISVHDAFDQAYVDSHLTRALVCAITRSAVFSGLSVTELANGGCEVRNSYQGVERLFRLKKARRDADGLLDVRVSSDSLLTHRVRAATLFDADEIELFDEVVQTEQWVLPYLINPSSRTLIQIYAALPIGTRQEHPPFRLILDNIVQIPHTSLPPKSFPKREDDLDIPGEEEKGGDEATG